MPMKTARRRLLRQAGALGVLAPMARVAAAKLPPGCSPSPQCRIECGPTASATAGPFYVANIAEGVDINPARAPGPPMRVSGTVYGADGVTPVRGARVEIWHADAQGAYHPADQGDVSRFRRGEVNLRGVTRTDAEGRYAFASIVPGHYGNRRRHLHWKVSAPGHRALTTQSYWLDERGTPRDQGDGADRRVEACRWVDFREEGGQFVGVFDIVLRTG
jgi:protocatechuate 3,4-dioxygenase beta subunit